MSQGSSGGIGQQQLQQTQQTAQAPGTTLNSLPANASGPSNPLPSGTTAAGASGAAPWTPMTANTPFIQQQVNAGLAGLPPDLTAYIQAQNPGQGLASYYNNASSLASNNPAQNSQIAQMMAGGQLPQNWYQGPAAPPAAPPGAPQSIFARGQSLSPAQMQNDMVAAHLESWANGNPINRSPYMIGQAPAEQQSVAAARGELAANGTPYPSAGIPGQQLGVGDMSGLFGGGASGMSPQSSMMGGGMSGMGPLGTAAMNALSR